MWRKNSTPQLTGSVNCQTCEWDHLGNFIQSSASQLTLRREEMSHPVEPGMNAYPKESWATKWLSLSFGIMKPQRTLIRTKNWPGDSVTPAGICVVSLFLMVVELEIHAFPVKLEIIRIWQNMRVNCQIFPPVVKEGQVLNQRHSNTSTWLSLAPRMHKDKRKNHRILRSRFLRNMPVWVSW